jgi:predicted transcriptional regulator
MDIVYEQGSASAAEVLEMLADPPSYSAVRAALRVLEEKGHLTHTREGHKYVFRPVMSRRKAQKGATQRLLKTFFDGSTTSAVTALLEEGDLDDADLDKLADLIDKAREDGR